MSERITRSKARGLNPAAKRALENEIVKAITSGGKHQRRITRARTPIKAPHQRPPEPPEPPTRKRPIEEVYDPEEEEDEPEEPEEPEEPGDSPIIEPSLIDDGLDRAIAMANELIEDGQIQVNEQIDILDEVIDTVENTNVIIPPDLKEQLFNAESPEAYQELMDQLVTLAPDKEATEEALAKQREEMTAAFQAEKRELITAYDAQVQKLKSDIKNQADELTTKFERDLESMRKRGEEQTQGERSIFAAQLKKHEDNLNRLQEWNERLQMDLDKQGTEYQRSLEELQGRLEGKFAGEKQQLQSQLETLEQEREQTGLELDNVREELRELQERMAQDTEMGENLQGIIVEKEQQLQEMEAELNNALMLKEVQIEELKRDLEEGKKEMGELSKINEEKELKLKAAYEILGEKDKKIEETEAQLRQLKEMAKQGKIDATERMALKAQYDTLLETREKEKQERDDLQASIKQLQGRVRERDILLGEKEKALEGRDIAYTQLGQKMDEQQEMFKGHLGKQKLANEAAREAERRQMEAATNEKVKQISDHINKLEDDIGLLQAKQAQQGFADQETQETIAQLTSERDQLTADLASERAGFKKKLEEAELELNEYKPAVQFDAEGNRIFGILKNKGEKGNVQFAPGEDPRMNVDDQGKFLSAAIEKPTPEASGDYRNKLKRGLNEPTGPTDMEVDGPEYDPNGDKARIKELEAEKKTNNIVVSNPPQPVPPQPAPIVINPPQKEEPMSKQSEMRMQDMMRMFKDSKDETNKLLRGFFYLMNGKKPVDLYALEKMQKRAGRIPAYGRDPEMGWIPPQYRKANLPKVTISYPPSAAKEVLKKVVHNAEGGITKRGAIKQPFTTYERIKVDVVDEKRAGKAKKRAAVKKLLKNIKLVKDKVKPKLKLKKTK